MNNPLGTLYLWSKNEEDFEKFEKQYGLDVDVVPEEFKHYIYYDIYQEKFPDFQIFLKLSDNLFKLIAIGPIEKDELMKRIDFFAYGDGYYAEYKFQDDFSYGADEDLKNMVREFLNDRKIRYKGPLPEFLANIISSQTSYVFSPSKSSVEKLITDCISYIDDSCRVGRADSETIDDYSDYDIVIYTSSTIDEIYSAKSNLIFILDGKDVTLAPDEFLNGLKTFAEVGGFIC